MNRATEYLKRHGETVADWEGNCGSLADKIQEHGDDMIWVEGAGIQWRYHMVVLSGGLIHDAWCDGDALPLPEWLAKMFGEEWVEVSKNGNDAFYEGPANKFTNAN
jgi:hypothetical protein